MGRGGNVISKCVSAADLCVILDKPQSLYEAQFPHW